MEGDLTSGPVSYCLPVWAVAINWAQTLQLGSIKGQLGILSHFGQFGVFQSNCSFPPFLTLNFAFSICICFCGLTV